MSTENTGGMILTGKNRRPRRKTYPSATLLTTNPTWIDPGANLGLRGERQATNHLRHGMAPEQGKSSDRTATFTLWIGVPHICCRLYLWRVCGMLIQNRGLKTIRHAGHILIYIGHGPGNWNIETIYLNKGLITTQELFKMATEHTIT
jgi:hypothetical protein